MPLVTGGELHLCTSVSATEASVNADFEWCLVQCVEL